MSDLDTYFQPTGRSFGSAGSLQPGAMSLMDRREAVSDMQNDQRRRMELARRVQRQLGRQSRSGDVRAGLIALDFMDREADAGQPIPAGISSFEESRARSAQTIMDNADQRALIDGITNGGGTGVGAGIATDPFVSTASPPMPTTSTPAFVASSPSDASSGNGGLSDLDRELLDAGRRVSGLRPPGFGSRPGGNLGFIASSVLSPSAPASTAPAAVPATSSVSAALPAASVRSMIPQEVMSRVAAMRDRNAQARMDRDWGQDRADYRYATGMERLGRERAMLDQEIAQRNALRSREDEIDAANRRSLLDRVDADRLAGERARYGVGSRRPNIVSSNFGSNRR